MIGTIVQLRRGLLRLLGAKAEDSIQRLRGEALYEVLDEGLQVGLWGAQRFLIDIGAGEDWRTISELTFGAADTAGRRTAEAPDGFLRFAGREGLSAMRRVDGRPWGQLLRDSGMFGIARGDWFFWMGGAVVVAPGARIDDDMLVDHYVRLALPSGDDEVGVEEDARSLVVAEAAYHLMHEYWVPANDGPMFEGRIARNRMNKRTEAAQAMRRSDGRQHLELPEGVGSHFLLT